MISVTEALSIITHHQVTTPTLKCDLNVSIGHRLAENLKAKLTLPPHDASAMDGYAVRLEDVRKARSRLSVVGKVPAGSTFDRRIGAGEAVRIFTGAPIPEGADHIVIQENTTRVDNEIEILKYHNTPRHIRRAGIDFNAGDILISQGCRLGPAELAIAAAANYNSLPVFSKPSVSIIAAGDELFLPGKAQALGDIVNSNTSALTALVETWGGDVTYTHLTRDNPRAIERMFKQAMQADVIVPVGGASVGDHDHMRRVFGKLGGKLIFEKIAVKPGKPTWFGKLNKRLVLGLPGNPASALVCAHLFLRPLMQGPEMIRSNAIVTEDMPANGPRETYFRGKLQFSKQSGQLMVTPFPRQDSSLLTPFLKANVLIRRESETPAIYKGEKLSVLLMGTGPSYF